jgi:hypothetical protein
MISQARAIRAQVHDARAVIADPAKTQSPILAVPIADRAGEAIAALRSQFLPGGSSPGSSSFVCAN